ncbi:hypothetical protein PULV_a1983 [Pseudoalteromonas ulvae UL12]|nr:hypothetical protein [Pseudoalteromonas ulvae UL12]
MIKKARNAGFFMQKICHITGMKVSLNRGLLVAFKISLSGC